MSDTVEVSDIFFKLNMAASLSEDSRSTFLPKHRWHVGIHLSSLRNLFCKAAATVSYFFIEFLCLKTLNSCHEARFITQ